MYKLLFLSFAFVLSPTIKAQDIAFHSVHNLDVSHKLSSEITPLITKGQFSYRYMGSDVFVNFDGEEHIEYHQNKKYYIRSKVQWISTDQCYLTIEHSTLPSFPFKKGARLHFKILNINKKKITFRSTLGTRSWKGKMKSILKN